MNKSTKSVLIFSIAANAVLFAGLAAGYVSIGKSSGAGASAQSAAASGGGNGSALSPEAARAMVALLTTDDLAALRDQLRALGLSEDDVRGIIVKRIAARNSARRREIMGAEPGAARERPYWRGRRDGVMDSNYTPAQRKEMRELEDEETKERRRLFGAEGESGFDAPRRYAFLSPEKAAQLTMLEDDYSTLKWRTIADMAGFQMPGDAEKLKLIEDENKRDKLALLTPGEKEEDALRNSETAWQLQRTLRGFVTTEEEYKAIFALQNALEEKYPGDASRMAEYYGGTDTSEYAKARDEEQKKIDAQIKDMLGEERYADYLRGQRRDYQSLMAAAERFNLSAETVVQTYQVRDDTANEAQRISDDASLSAAQKREAYAALAEQATAQIKASLGDDVGAAYIDNALGWLKNLPRGGKVSIGAKGNVNVTQPKAGKAKRGQGGK